MARSTPALVNPEVLRWARESIGYSRRDAADAIGAFEWQVELAETGDHELTLRQAEKLAALYDRPLATLFLPEPPAEESQEALFRRLPGAPAPPWPPDLRKLARRVSDRQDAAVEIYELIEESPPWENARTGMSEGRDAAKRARAALGISLEEQFAWTDPVGYEALRNWVDAVEALGVLVMQDGSLGLDALRGFASLHPQVPAILINTKDDPRARAFTVIHELGHLVNPTASEVWCNEFAGDLLMPADALRAVVAGHASERPAKWVNEVAKLFSVTPLAVAVRVARIGLLPEGQVTGLIGLVRSRQSKPRRPGGNYYRNKITWLGPAFIRLVMNAVDDQAVTLSNAAGLLEAKVDHFPGLRQTVDDRAQFG